LKLVIEGRMEGKRPRGWKRFSMLDELIDGKSYAVMKRRTTDRELWRRWMPETCLWTENL